MSKRLEALAIEIARKLTYPLTDGWQNDPEHVEALRKTFPKALAANAGSIAAALREAEARGRAEGVNDPTGFRTAKASGTMRSGLAMVRIECGSAYEEIAILNPDLVLEDWPLRAALLSQIEPKLLGVIRAGLKDRG